MQSGDWHVHTNYTDGRDSVDDLCCQAVANGLKLVAFTEHVRKKLTYDFKEFVREISEARKKYNIEILSGCEVKVLDLSGNLDVNTDTLKYCDIVIGVFHSFAWPNKSDYLKALESMLCNPFIDVWGHPTFFTDKNKIVLDSHEINRIATICEHNDVLVEINLKYNTTGNFLEIMQGYNINFVISSDAHSVNDLLTNSRLMNNWQEFKSKF